MTAATGTDIFLFPLRNAFPPRMDNCYTLPQLRKPVSTLSIPGSMKTPCAGGNRDSAAVAGNEEAGIALVGVHSEYPR